MAVSQHHREDTVQLIKETADIAEIIGEHVNLKKSGVNLKGLCPFHSEKTPSFMVNPERKSFHCFGCGEGGDVFTFMMNFHRLTFPEALKELAQRYQITLPEENLSPADQAEAQKRQLLYEINEQAATIYHDHLLSSSDAAGARKYLHGRGITSEVIKSFCLGYGPDSWDFIIKKLSTAYSLEDIKDAGLIVAKEQGGYYDRFRGRILFPIFGLTGKILGFGGRILEDGQPKYLNTQETLIFDKSRTLFGIYQNKDSIRKEQKCIIVEGNFDLLSLVVHGTNNVVAPLGTALTQAQVRSLKGYSDEAILLFDGDGAGLKAAKRSVPIFLTEQMPAKIAVLPENHDPDTFVSEFGQKGLLKLLDKAMSLPEFVFSRLVDQYGLTLEGKGKIVAELQPLINTIEDRHLQRTLFISHFSKKLDLTPEQLLNGVRSTTPSLSKTTKGKSAETLKLPKKQEQLLEFLIIYPEHLQDFIEAGIEDVVLDEHGRNILAHLKIFIQQGSGAGPEGILAMVDGPEKSFISKLLVSTPAYPDEIREAIVKEWTTWLKKNSLKIKKEHLTSQINEAHKSQNETLYMELMAQKKKMDEALAN